MGAWRSKSERRPAGRRRGVARTAAMIACAAALATSLVVAGCGAEVGPTETIRIDEPLASAAVTDVELVMGAGSLSITPGATGLVSGIIRCNVEDWQPQIRRSDTRLLIQQKSRDAISGLETAVINEWGLQLGQSPMRLRISAGAYEAALDLSGLTLQDLSIEDGASQTQVMFNSPNPGQMERLWFKTGASAVSLIGLANANFKSMQFTGGAGTFTFDFSGQLRTKATAKIVLGTGTVRIQVPASTAVVVKAIGSQIAVDTQGTWVTKGQTHSTPAVAANKDGKVLTVELEMGAGTATLVAK